MSIVNTRITSVTSLSTPRELKDELPLTKRAQQTVTRGRREIADVLNGEDARFLVIVGPCSLHDPAAALEYTTKLATLKEELTDKLLIVQRTYFEKPRTTIGWKGLINDPHLDGSSDIAEGYRLARKTLLRINELGIPCATEFLEPTTPQYIDDLVSWAAIGARTTESQPHRQMASGLSMPIGFKNGTGGGVKIAVNALLAAQESQIFQGIDPKTGAPAKMETVGNPDVHLILRGGNGSPNYKPEQVSDALLLLKEANLPERLLVDCSHANSGKKHENQELVLRDVLDQRRAGTKAIRGVMLESFLKPGKQKLTDPANLEYGLSITDECLGWDQTEKLLRQAADMLSPSLSS